jgi:putative inorganic carbon (HCO3(-)) transporter
MLAMRASLAPVCLALLPLVAWPGLAQPFSIPKLVVIATGALVLAAMPAPTPWREVPSTMRWAVGVWAVSFLVSGLVAPLPALGPLVLGLAAPVLAMAAVRHAPAESLMRAQAVGATLCALVAVFQWCGVDPITWLGWSAPIDGASVRMRVYGTLGNPNFVGVLMAMSLPLTAALHRRSESPRHTRMWEGAMALQALALVATGSRGAVLGLAAAIIVYASLRWSPRVRVALAALLVFGVVAVALSPARPIDTTVAGRLHLWRIATPHAFEQPVTGWGPGAVPLRFPEWQRAAARAGVRDRRFAGPTDHVHNDYLESLIERGIPGLLSLLLPLALTVVVVVRHARPASPLLTGAAAAIAAGAACALVDFPLARPVALAWWWLGIAIVMASKADATQRQ